jgi:HlyD family secretion protein
MSATVDITTSVVNDALSVPIQAVTVRSDTTSRMRYAAKDNEVKEESLSKTKEEEEAEKKRALKEMKEYVFVFSEGKVKIRQVRTGIQDDEYMQILSGLKEGEEVVVAPYSAISSKLYNGQRVVKVDKEKLYDSE